MLKIGDVSVANRLFLAPMEDVTAQPMRRIAKRIAAPGLMFTEFVSAMAIHFNARKTWKKLAVHPDERPLAIQIFGGDPAIMAETARVAWEHGPDTLDINMGCWVPKVCKTGAGAALLKDPENAVRIVEAVVRAVPIPVTVKLRAGYEYGLFTAPDLVARFQDAGARMITLHARFAKQGYDGFADWELIRRLRDVVHVPLVGNGDVKTPEDALRLRAETGCDAVMVGRAAISNPWRLRDIRLALDGLPSGPEPTLRERIETAMEHLRMQVEYEANADPRDAEFRACRELRGQIPIYIKGEPGASQVRDRLTRCSSIAEYEDVLGAFAAVAAG